MAKTRAFLNNRMNLSGIANLGPQFIKQRPFVGLFLATLLVTGFLPLLTYLLFTCAVVSLGVFLLVVIESGIITMATVTLLVFLIIPVCIATGVSLLAYSLYFALSQMKILVESAVNGPQNFHFGGEGLKKKRDEKPSFEGNIRFRSAQISSDVSGTDSDSEDITASGKKVCTMSQNQH